MQLLSGNGCVVKPLVHAADQVNYRRQADELRVANEDLRNKKRELLKLEGKNADVGSPLRFSNVP